MEERVKIKKVSVSDWKDYKEIRLHALKNNPESFSGSYEERVKAKSDYWKSKIGDKDVRIFLAYLNKSPVGVFILAFKSSPKVKHIANIYSVYVREDCRGKGVGSKLMDAVLKEAKSKKYVEKIALSVIAGQESAIKLYEKFGFVKLVVLKKEMKIGKKYYDEMLMEKIL